MKRDILKKTTVGRLYFLWRYAADSRKKLIYAFLLHAVAHHIHGSGYEDMRKVVTDYTSSRFYMDAFRHVTLKGMTEEAFSLIGFLQSICPGMVTCLKGAEGKAVFLADDLDALMDGIIKA